MKNIITIQHTQSVHHTNGMIGSWTDWDLTDFGKKQAERIGSNLANEIPDKKWVMYSSDLLRAKQTASIVAKHLKIEPVLLKALRERNLGSAVGKSVEWLHNNQIAREMKIDDRCLDDAESRRDVWNRLKPFYDEIMDKAEENIIIVSHGDTLSILNAMWLGIEPEMLNHCDLFGMAGGVSFFNQGQDKKHKIRKLSDMSYIK